MAKKPTAKTNVVPIPAAARARMFDAGKAGRRLKGVPTAQEAINTQIRRYGKSIVARSRYLCTNNPYASQAKETWVSSLVGDGIVPRSKSPQHKEEIQQAWLDWTDYADADGLTDLYGLETVIGAEMFEAGEVFVRYRSRREEDGLPVPLQLQILPAEMLDWNYNALLPNGRIEMGVEFGPIGQRVAYHFWRQHPDADFPILLDSARVRVPAEEVLHCFRPIRAGQVRGIPHTVAAIVKMAILDQYDDAELERKKTAALFAAFVTKGVGEAPILQNEDTEANAEGTPWSLEPGAVITLETGESVAFSQPADVGANYETFQYRTLLAISAGYGVPYADMTGDLRQANYGSIRAGLVKFRRQISATQNQVIVFQFCRKVWERWFTEAVLAGVLPISPSDFLANKTAYLRADWRTPKFEWIDPYNDARSEKLAVDSGFKARSDVIAESGQDAEEVDARIAADKAREEALGLEFVVGSNVPSPSEKEQDPTPAQDNNGGPPNGA